MTDTATLTLPDWLDDVRRRDCTITITDGVIHVRGTAATWHDHQHTASWRHALHLATDGTHPTWWNWASGRDRTTVPTPDDLPWTCACCGAPDCRHLDADLLAWCDQHHDPETDR